MGSSFEILRGWETGQIAAILNKVSGGDRTKLEAILRDELEINLAEKEQTLVDKNGRVIPSRDLKSAVCEPNRRFYPQQPKLETFDDFGSRQKRFENAFGSGPCSIADAEFQDRTRKLIGEIEKNRRIANLLSGVHLPIILPRLESGDYGAVLEQIFLPRVKSAYEKEFPKRKLYNCRENDLESKVSVVPGMRHEKLLERMAGGSVVAIYFPNPLQGFSIRASREQLSDFPDSLLLSGGFDTATAMVMYPDILARDWYTPGLDLSALSWQSPGGSLCFRASGDDLYFGGRGVLAGARDGYSSGLLFFGSV